MQYESIILELMTRIKKLEDDIKQLQEKVETLSRTPASSITAPMEIPSLPSISTSYSKVTSEMIDLCYTLGKQAHANTSLNMWDLADQAEEKTAMNRNSAFMYIYVVRCMLEGSIYKRAISTMATKQYFTHIFAEFGAEGLAKALQATKLNLEYRSSMNIPSASIQKVYDEFMAKL